MNVQAFVWAGHEPSSVRVHRRCRWIDPGSNADLPDRQCGWEASRPTKEDKCAILHSCAPSASGFWPRHRARYSRRSRTPKFTFGVKGGMSTAKLFGDAIDDADWRNGFVGGGFASYRFGNTFAIQPEVLFAQKGTALNTLDGGSTGSCVSTTSRSRCSRSCCCRSRTCQPAAIPHGGAVACVQDVL
ncbi:MAG: porin family protein [Longimicrobiales bacterium]